jgi:hypothetical protein
MGADTARANSPAKSETGKIVGANAIIGAQASALATTNFTGG